MKIRNGFVSNSSSSSFIIAVKPNEKCDKCGRSDPNFLDIVDKLGYNNYDSEQTHLHARGAQQIENYYKNEMYPYFSKEDIEKWKINLKKIKQMEKQGYEVACLVISYHDDVTNEMFQDFKDRKCIEIINGDEN